MSSFLAAEIFAAGHFTAGQVTGIGSLPHTDHDEAVRFIAEYSPTIPFWPQLPQRAEAEIMIPQMLSPLLDLLQRQGTARFDIPAAKVDAFHQRLREADAVLEVHSASGFYAFERACQSNVFPQAVALKGQITGPITLSHCVFVEDRPLAAYPELLDAFTDYLCRLGVWQVERLQHFGKPVLIFIDEAILALGAFSAQLTSSLEKLIHALRTSGAIVGIHCCADEVPDLMTQVRPDIISFDAHQQLEAFLAKTDVQRFVERGGWLAFGIVPTAEDLSQFNAGQVFMRLLSAFEGRYDPAQLVSQSLITATCGLGLLNLDSARASFTKCHEVSRLMQRMAYVSEGYGRP